MLYRYKAVESASGAQQAGTIDAANVDVAISALQRRNFVILSIVPDNETPFWQRSFTVFNPVKYKDVVVLSRQISTLFGANVSALRVFQLLGQENDNPVIKRKLAEIAEDIQGGTSLSNALAKQNDVFSEFYINMVKSGEESGNLSSTFDYLAGYLDRSYELTSKTKNALIYPAFVITVFVAVMIIMLVVVIPKLATIIIESGVEVPVFTKIVIAASNALVEWGILVLAVIIAVGFFAWRYFTSADGRVILSRIILGTPVVGELYRKIFLARIADNVNTMLTSGIPVVRTLEICANVVGSKIYKDLLTEASGAVRGGKSLSQSLDPYPHEIPKIMVQMIRVGEETGEVGKILDTLAKFYKREVDNAIESLLGMIEPAMIVLLGVGVGGLLTSVLIPIYDIATSV
jgi:type IV pilus assembly protein PilC